MLYHDDYAVQAYGDIHINNEKMVDIPRSGQYSCLFRGIQCNVLKDDVAHRNLHSFLKFADGLILKIRKILTTAILVHSDRTSSSDIS